MTPFEIKVNDKELENLVTDHLDKIVSSRLDGLTWTLDQFRKACCGGKSKEWVTLYVLAEFSSEIDYNKPKGWLIPSKGRGSQNIIFAKKACEWMEANRSRIDWEGKVR